MDKEMIKVELNPELTIGIKIECQDRDISTVNIKTEQDVDTKDLINELLQTAIKDEQESDDDIYKINIKEEKLVSAVKEETSSNEKEGQSFPEIKTEELMLKSESESGDSGTGTNKKSQMKHSTMIKHGNHYDYRSDRQTHLKRHIIAKKDENLIETYGNGFRYYRTFYTSHLKYHVFKKYDIAVKKHGCCNCDYNTNQKDSLRIRMMCKHDNNSTKRYVCDFCGYTTHWQSNLARHTMAKHDKNAVKKHGCHLCDYRTHMAYRLNRHLKEKHEVILRQPVLSKHDGKAEKLSLGTVT